MRYDTKLYLQVLILNHYFYNNLRKLSLQTFTPIDFQITFILWKFNQTFWLNTLVCDDNLIF